MRRVGFIGIGTIGMPMAKNIVRGGYDVTVFDLAPARIAEMHDFGAKPAGSIAEAVKGQDVVITMLPDAPDVEGAALGAGGILESIGQDAIYIDMSTIDPATTRRVGERFAARGVRMIDSPVTRSVEQAITEDEPTFPEIDGDALIEASAATDADEDPDAVVAQLDHEARRLATIATSAGPANWNRGITVGAQRSTIRRLLEHALHDSLHHLDDVERGLRVLRS